MIDRNQTQPLPSFWANRSPFLTCIVYAGPADPGRDRPEGHAVYPPPVPPEAGIGIDAPGAAVVATRHGHAARPCGTAMRHGHAARPCGTAMRHGHAARPCGTATQPPSGIPTRPCDARPPVASGRRVVHRGCRSAGFILQILPCITMTTRLAAYRTPIPPFCRSNREMPQ